VTRHRQSKLLALSVAAALVLALGACGDDDDSASTADQGSADAPAQGASDALVAPAETDLGEVLTTADGLTVYGFTNDSGGTSSCEAGCVDAWPPVTVDGAEVPEGLDAAVFSVTERSDGTFQLVAGDWPLYTFAGDAAAGDVNGQGQGGVWFVVSPDGELNKDAGAGSGGSDQPAPSNPY
jgi:predicted lipoprotein with Yx(FWY)xxD motif